MNWGAILSNPIVQQVLVQVVSWGTPLILAGLGWLIIQGIKLLAAKIKESDTKIDDWMLGVAVKFAEDKIGPGKGEEKLKIACEFIETFSKGKIKASVIEPLVRAKYIEVFGELSKLKNG